MPPQIDTSGYTIQSVDYYKRALACYDAVPKTGSVAFLFYSALEARNGIERLLYEYLVVFGHPQWDPRWERNGLYRPADLKRHILNVEPEFDRKLQFTGVVASGGSGVGVYPIDLDKMSEMYGRLGRFLHAPKMPEDSVQDSAWWGELQARLVETLEILRDVYSQVVGGVQFHNGGEELYQRWKAGGLTDDQVRSEFWGDEDDAADDSA